MVLIAASAIAPLDEIPLHIRGRHGPTLGIRKMALGRGDYLERRPGTTTTRLHRLTSVLHGLPVCERDNADNRRLDRANGAVALALPI
jgi:hypothetical protein